MKQPFISVVVLAYNQFERTTLPCLQSLTPWFEDDDFEFIVFDNASPDGSGTLAQTWCNAHPRLKFVQSNANLGYAGGMNATAALAQGQWLFLVNNDTEFPAHALEALKKVLSSVPENMAMVGPVTNSAGNGQRLYDPTKSKEEWLELGAWLNTHPTGMLLPTYRCDFFCIAIRRDTWIALNGLDSAFGMGYFEDFDFSLRLRKAGFDQAITEDVFIYHQGSANFSTSPTKMKSLIKKNKNILKKKHSFVKFLHARICNLELLKIQLSIQTIEAEEFYIRKNIRAKSLQLDQPKNPVKKAIWRFRIRGLSDY